MDHVAANNEIIRMRATVRKARVGVIWKTTKQAKLLKNRTHGDEVTLQKFKKKSEKLIKEIKAIKALKDDDIAKFAILNTRSLQEVLADSTIDRRTRVMTKLAYHKGLKEAVDKFKEKFPNYHLGKRQLANNKLRESLGIKALPGKPGTVDPHEEDRVKSDSANNNFNEDGDSEGDEQSATETSLQSDNCSENSDAELIVKTESGEEPPALEGNDIKAKKTVSSTENGKVGKRKIKSASNSDTIKSNIVEETPGEISSLPSKTSKKSSRNNAKTPSKDSPNTNSTPELENSSEKSRKSRPVSQLASIKLLKIGESLEEIEGVSEAPNSPLPECKIELDTVEDSFFISAAPGGVYKSVVVPRPDTGTVEDDDSRNEFKESFHRRKQGGISSKRGAETSGYGKDHKVRRNDFDRSKTDFSGRQGPGKDKSGMQVRRDRKFDNKKDNHTVTKDNHGENLHPSWIARKKQQEILKQGFQGKKIVFSDD
ncbi:serum response factor-binding protein 1-like [Diachasmimorpha longicaudata]|uniref:serum response factor-binding protein 1-like n=1 Tax=Diachasmimorpha longicaudata TaxID=58733 RepID=UPI0030B88C5B